MHPITINPIPKIAIPATAFPSVFLVLGPNIVDLRMKYPTYPIAINPKIAAMARILMRISP